jgi:hypothetical protein
MLNNFLFGLSIIALGGSMIWKPDFWGNIIPPTFFIDKMGMSTRSAYQIIGFLIGFLGFLIAVTIIKVF